MTRQVQRMVARYRLLADGRTAIQEGFPDDILLLDRFHPPRPSSFGFPP